MLTRLVAVLSASLMSVLVGCSTAPERPESKVVLEAQVEESLAEFKAKYPSINDYIESSYGYAVLPNVLKGAFWVGGAQGKGAVYEQGSLVGYIRMTQATLGFSFGGQSFREVVFFSDQATLNRFRTGPFTFSGQVTALVLEAGAAAKVNYRDGMAVFVLTRAGLIVDASIGGQKFKYVPN